MRHQRGYIYQASGSFFVRFYSFGQQVSHRLCSKDDKYYSRTCRAVKMLADEFMQSVNAGKVGNTQDISIVKFWEQTYLPFAVENLRHSTMYGYRQVWGQHLEKHFGTLTLREYRTHMGSAFSPAYLRSPLEGAGCAGQPSTHPVPGLWHLLSRR